MNVAPDPESASADVPATVGSENENASGEATGPAAFVTVRLCVGISCAMSNATDDGANVSVATGVVVAPAVDDGVSLADAPGVVAGAAVDGVAGENVEGADGVEVTGGVLVRTAVLGVGSGPAVVPDGGGPDEPPLQATRSEHAARAAPRDGSDESERRNDEDMSDLRTRSRTAPVSTIFAHSKRLAFS